MPELPEVETIRRDLAERLLGRKITGVNILNDKTALPSAAFLNSQLPGRRVKAIERRGKLLIVSLVEKRGAPSNLLIHLKMTGQLIYLEGKLKLGGGHSLESKGQSSLESAAGGNLPNKYTRVILSFGSAHLYFNDLRKFGYLRLASNEELAKLLSNNYGPEPLTPGFTVSALAAAIKGRSINIKALLLDQKRVAGLGNIYVDESLYAAGIRPARRASSLKTKEIEKLHKEIKRIITLAVKKRGTTFSDYVDSRGRSGNFSNFLKVYGRAGQACSKCQKPITKIKLAGRGTHYCPSCQH